SEDQGRFDVQTEAIQGIGFDEMVRHQRMVGEVLDSDPNVAFFTNQAGQTDAGGAMNTGRLRVELKPRSERAQSVDEVIAELRPKLAAIPGIRAFMVNPPPINIGGRQARAVYQFTLQGTDTAELYRWSRVLEGRMRALPQLDDVNSDLLDRNPQISVHMDRD